MFEGEFFAKFIRGFFKGPAIVKRAFFGTLGAFLVFIFFLGGVVFLPALRTITNDISRLQIETAKSAAISVSASADSVLKAHKEMAEDLGLADSSETDMKLALFLKRNKFFREVSFVGRGGRELEKLRQFPFVADLPRSRAGEAVFERAIAGEFYLGPVFFSTEARPVVEISLPLKNGQGAIEGAFIAEVDLGFMWGLLNSIEVGPRGGVYVFDRNGNLVSDKNLSRVLSGVNVSFRPIVRSVLDGNTVDINSADSFYKNFNEEDVFAVGVPLKNLGWGVVVENNEADAFASWYRFILLIAIFFTLSALLFGLLFLSVRGIIRLFSDLDLEQRQVRAIISNLTDGLIEYSENFRIMLVNPMAEKILGISASDAVGRKFEPKDSADPKLSSFALALFPVLAEEARAIKEDKEHPKAIELKIHHPLERDLQVITVPVLGEHERVFSYLKVIRDVTREKAIAKTKSEFISLAAHQLRTPLSAIKWTFSMALSGDAGAVSRPVKDLLFNGFKANERMITLVNDLLNVARIEEGRFGYKFEKGNVVETVKKNVDSFDILSRESGVEIKFFPPASLLPEISYDEERLSLALSNLVENAIYYSQGAKGRVEVKVYADGDFVKIEVRDNGMGIPEGHKAKLFTKFQRAANAVKAHTEGSGLGLFIVKNIIKRHGGEIVVESEEGKGSSFIVSLPMDETKIPEVTEVYEGI